MRYLQNVLLMIGASALGLVSCVAIAFCIVAAFTKLGSGEEWGSAIFLALFSFCGAVSGAIIGFIAALRWIAQQEGKSWTWMTWIGILVGIASALIIRFTGVLDFFQLNTLGDLIEKRLGFAIFVAAAACLGGIIGGWAGLWRARNVA